MALLRLLLSSALFLSLTGGGMTLTPASISAPIATPSEFQQLKTSESHSLKSLNEPLSLSASEASFKLSDSKDSGQNERADFDCPRQNGDFPYPADPNKFFRCRMGLAILQSCGPLSRFSAQGQRCLVWDTRWFCTSNVEPLTPLKGKYDTVERCWVEAVRKRSHYLSIGLTGCRVGKKVSSMTDEVCSNSSHHVIDVLYHQQDLVRLNPDYRFWVSGKPASGVRWGRLQGVNMTSRRISDCSEVCVTYGRDFSRVDADGCTCGEAEDKSVQIRHEDLGWASGHLSTVQPGFTVQLRAGNITGWLCTSDPSSKFSKVTGAQTMQEALKACQARRFEFLAAGEEGFFCGNNTANLERFSRSQCEMKLTKQRSYSVISINEIEREITHVEESVHEYIFWWVREKAPSVFWTALADVSSLEQCVLQCNKRFICVGADGCSCGSLRSNAEDITVREWVKTQPKNKLGSGQGYLLLDKKGSINIPEGWQCASEPSRWKRTNDALLGSCLNTCAKEKFRFMAFGEGGCRCGSSGSTLQHLAMPHCQNPEGAKVSPFTVLFVDVWSNNFGNYSAKDGYKAYWVSKKPKGVKWEVAAGRTVAQDCLRACEDKKGVKLMLLGVDGCECGFTTSDGYKSSLTWSVNSDPRPARGFFMIEKETVSKGYTAPVFSWITKRNNTERKENKPEEENRWIRVSTKEKTSGRRRTNQSREEIQSNQLERRNSSQESSLMQAQQRSVVNSKDTSTTVARTREQQNQTSAKVGQIENNVVRTTEKKGTSNLFKNTTNETEKNFVSAQANAITVGSNKRRLVNLEAENAARQSQEAYKLRTVTGEQTKGTIEHYISGEKSRLVRLNDTNTKMLEKNVAADRTNLNASATAHAIRRLNIKQSRVTGTQRSRSVGLQIHIGGVCYTGEANKTGWSGPVENAKSPFKCLCSCVKTMNLFYAIYEQGKCLCAAAASNFGKSTGHITTTGECPDAASRVVYNGIKHTQQLTEFCEGAKSTDNSVLFSGNTKLNEGARLIEFNNTDSLRVLKKHSALQATHRRRKEQDTRTDVLREHEKRGTIKEKWRSTLSKGLFSRLFRLKLHVRRQHNVVEKVNLLTKQDTRESEHQHAPIFLPTSAPRAKDD